MSAVSTSAWIPPRECPRAHCPAPIKGHPSSLCCLSWSTVWALGACPCELTLRFSCGHWSQIYSAEPVSPGLCPPSQQSGRKEGHLVGLTSLLAAAQGVLQLKRKAVGVFRGVFHSVQRCGQRLGSKGRREQRSRTLTVGPVSPLGQSHLGKGQQPQSVRRGETEAGRDRERRGDGRRKQRQTPEREGVGITGSRRLRPGPA